MAANLDVSSLYVLFASPLPEDEKEVDLPALQNGGLFKLSTDLDTTLHFPVFVEGK